MASSSDRKPSESPVLLDVAPPLATITLNRPSRGNALSPPLQQLLLEHLDAIAADDMIHYVLLTGRGKYFCTGMDLGSGAGAAEGVGVEDLFAKGREFFDKLERFPKPIIGLANGPCYGGGCGIFFLTDIRISAPSNTFTLSEVTRGLVPALISPTMVREWGVPLAREAMLTARPVTAAELSRLGAVHRLVASGSNGRIEVEEVCEMLKRGAPKAMSRCKDLARTQAKAGLSLEASSAERTQATQAVRDAFEEMMAPSAEALHGIMTFRETKGKAPVDWLSFYREQSDGEAQAAAKTKL